MAYVLALGFFDGVHIGHAAIMRRASELAREKGLKAAAVTFDRPPREVVTGVRVPRITTLSRRVEIIQNEFNMETFVLTFDRQLMNTPWQEYAAQYLTQRYKAAWLVFGRDYRFGSKGNGNAQNLSEYCKEHDIGFVIMDKIRYEGIDISSSRIRREIEHGSVQLAALMLGRPFEVRGTVQRGRSLGGTLGFPTLNLSLPEELVRPMDGVYRTRVVLEERTYNAVSNLGLRPTVDGQTRVLESHLLGFEGDAYDKNLTVQFLNRIRGEKKFPDIQSLRKQVLHDIETVKKEV